MELMADLFAVESSSAHSPHLTILVRRVSRAERDESQESWESSLVSSRGRRRRRRRWWFRKVVGANRDESRRWNPLQCLLFPREASGRAPAASGIFHPFPHCFSFLLSFFDRLRRSRTKRVSASYSSSIFGISLFSSMFVIRS